VSKRSEAIDESISRDQIVHIDVAPHDIEDLKAEADDWVANGDEIEFWGRNEGHTWRVHARMVHGEDERN
jgi:hypothetical protein